MLFNSFEKKKQHDVDDEFADSSHSFRKAKKPPNLADRPTAVLLDPEGLTYFLSG